jgi:uncharacterized RDD family membrane protein YckC
MKQVLLPILFLLVVPSALLAAPEVSVEADLDEDIHIGTPFQVVYTVQVGGDTVVHFPTPPFLKAPIRLLKQENEVGTPKAGQITEKHTLTLTSLRTGKHEIPSFDIPYVTNGVGGTLQGNTVPFVVRTRLGKELDPMFKEPAPPFPIYYRNWTLLTALGAVGVIILAILGTLLAIRLFGHKYRETEPGPPPRPAHELALERLESLENGTWRMEEDYHGFFFELTELTKQYLENRYRTGATAETSTEVLKAMEELSPEGLSIELLRELMRGADLVKYARSATSEAEAVVAMESCRQLIESTKQTEEQFQADQETEEEFELVDAPFRMRIAGIVGDLALICWTVIGIHEALQFWTQSVFALPICLALLMFLVVFKDIGGKTPGRWLMGLRIRTEEGLLPPFAATLRRNLLLSIPILGWTAEGVWALLDPKNRRPGDRIIKVGSQLEDPQQLSPALLGGIGSIALLGGLLFLLFRLASILEGGLS